MSLLTVSNLYPRPDRPQFGLFNAQLFAALQGFAGGVAEGSGVPCNLCLVPEWRLWRWPGIRAWECPLKAGPPTAYAPVFYLPLAGRALGHRCYAASLGPWRTLLRKTERVLTAWLYPDGAAISRLLLGSGAASWLMALGTDADHLASGTRWRAIGRACREARGTVCVSKPLAVRLRDAGVDDASLHVVPNGVDRERFHFRSKADAWAALSQGGRAVDVDGLRDVKTVLFVGNLVDVKRPDLCVAAFGGLAGGGEDREAAQLVVIGAGPLRGRLETLAREQAPAGSVRFLGSRPHEEVALWMNVADALCLSSRSEGMPNVIREALASGLPVVATDVGACADMLREEAASRVVAPGDAAGLRDALAAVLADSTDREALARRQGAYTWHDQARRISELMGLACGSASCVSSA